MTTRDTAPADNSLGPDGRVCLRCYLPHADTTWLSAGCCGEHGCYRIVPISIHEAIRLMGTAEATVGDVERRLRCRVCGWRDVQIQIATDPRPHEVREREGLLQEVRARLSG